MFPQPGRKAGASALPCVPWRRNSSTVKGGHLHPPQQPCLCRPHSYLQLCPLCVARDCCAGSKPAAMCMCGCWWVHTAAGLSRITPANPSTRQYALLRLPGCCCCLQYSSRTSCCMHEWEMHLIALVAEVSWGSNEMMALCSRPNHCAWEVGSTCIAHAGVTRR